MVKAGIGPKERQTFWPAVFTSKMIRASYINKGAASKVYDVQSGKYHSEVIFGTYEMHGSEGRLAGYICNVNRAATSKSVIGLGRECSTNINRPRPFLVKRQSWTKRLPKTRLVKRS